MDDELVAEQGKCSRCGKHLNPGQGSILTPAQVADLRRRQHIAKEAVKAQMKAAHGKTWKEGRPLPPDQFDGPPLDKVVRVKEQDSTNWHIKIELMKSIMCLRISAHSRVSKMFREFLTVVKFRPHEICFSPGWAADPARRSKVVHRPGPLGWRPHQGDQPLGPFAASGEAPQHEQQG